MEGFTSPEELMHRHHKKGACHVIGKTYRLKTPAKKAACARRVKGFNTRVGGTKGHYRLLACGRRKSMRGRRKK